MSRKRILSCQACGRPVVRDAAVRLRVAGRRGPDAVDFVQTEAELMVCPVCARTRRFRIVPAADAAPATPQGDPPPS